ncbi:hypothetical protein BH10ACT3_BH10ACT3_23180 [soil metagenome]
MTVGRGEMASGADEPVEQIDLRVDIADTVGDDEIDDSAIDAMLEDVGTVPAPPTPARKPRTALVLGAGGTMGIAYHAGVVKALSDAGLDQEVVDLVLGTSAGSIVGSILRCGHDVDRVWQLAHDDVNPFMEGAPFFRPEVVFSQGWRTPMGLARRIVGSGYVIPRSIVKWPVVTPPAVLQRFYRGGLASVTEQRAEYALWTGEDWPDGLLWLCAFDIVTGRRIVLGQRVDSRPPLPDAMRASSAVPIMYPPVRFGRRLLVDGAVSSSTNLDVAIEAGAEFVVVAAPLAYDHEDPPSMHLRVTREFMDRKVRNEVKRAEKAGVKVLLIRPNAEEAEVQGLNFLRSGGNAEVADLSHRATRAALATPAGRAFARSWRAANRSTARAVARERAGDAASA